MITPYQRARDYLESRLEEVAQFLLPGGSKKGSEWCGLSKNVGGPGDSFSIHIGSGNKRGILKHFGSDEKGTSDVVQTWMRLRGIAEKNWEALFTDLKSWCGQDFGYAAPGAPLDWLKCLADWTEADAQKLCNLRGFTPEFVNWLHANRGVGMHQGHIAFPVIGPGGSVVGLQRYFDEERKLKFTKNCKVQVLLFGDMGVITELHVHESSWDCYALASASGWYLTAGLRFLATRGAGNAKLLKGQVPPGVKVYAWEQHDTPGQNGRIPNDFWFKGIAAVAGCGIYRVKIPEQHKDLNDWVRAGVTEAELAAAVAAAELYGRPSLAEEYATTQAAAVFPSFLERPLFRCYLAAIEGRTKTYPPGVYWHGIAGKGEDKFPVDTWIAAYLDIEAITCTRDDLEYGRLLRFISSEGQHKKWAMPMELLAADGSEILAQLLRAGLEINHPHRSKILEYIAQAKPAELIRCASRTGWHSDKIFVLTDEVLGNDKVWFQAISRTADYAKGGTLEDWKNRVAARAVDNVYLMFALSFALAGPLMEPLQLPGIANHLYGDSTIGKTSMLEAATSVWGHGHDFVQTWNVTANGLEGVCAEHSDTLLPLDEIKEVEPRDLNHVAYSAMNGHGKIRATRTGQARPALRWRVALLSTGEPSVKAKLAEGGIDIRAGQELRLIDVPVTDERFGVFSNLHRARDGAEFANLLRAGASENYGHAGRLMVEAILKSNRNDLQQKYSQILSRFPTENAQELRAARTFAVAALAGELAAIYKIVPWQAAGFEDYSESEPVNAAIVLFNRWRKSRERLSSTYGAETSKIVRAIRDFIEKHGDSRFSDVRAANDAIIRDRAGWWDDSILDHRVFLFTNSGLSEATAGYDFERVKKALHQAEAFAKKGSGKTSVVTRIRGGPRKRLFYIDPEKLDYFDPGEVD